MIENKVRCKYAGSKDFAGPQPGTAAQVIFMYRKDLDHWLLMERAPHIRSQTSWAVAPPLLRILSRFQASLASLAASVKCKFVMLHLPEAGPCHPLDSPRPAVLKFSHSHCHGFSDDQQESRNQEQQVNWGVESLLTDPKYPGQN